MDPTILNACAGAGAGILREILSDRDLKFPHYENNGDGPRLVFGDIIPAVVGGASAGMSLGMTTQNPLAVFLGSVGAVDIGHNTVQSLKPKK